MVKVDVQNTQNYTFHLTLNISVCDQMVNVSFVISVCRSNDSISLVAELARISQVPTIQVDLNYWSLPLNFNGQKSLFVRKYLWNLQERVYQQYLLPPILLWFCQHWYFKMWLQIFLPTWTSHQTARCCTIICIVSETLFLACYI